MTRERSRIFNDNRPGKYFWQTANIVDDLDISPIAFRLYSRLVRISSLHAVDVSTRALAKACRVSMGSISNAKVELVEAVLISITKRPSGRGEDYDEIHILDITARNIRHCETLFVSSPHELSEVHSSPDERNSSPDERNSSPDERNSSCGEHLTRKGQKEGQEEGKKKERALRAPATPRRQIPDSDVPPSIRNMGKPPKRMRAFVKGSHKSYDPNPVNKSASVKAYRRVFPYVSLSRHETKAIANWKDVDLLVGVLDEWKRGVVAYEWRANNWTAIGERYRKAVYLRDHPEEATKNNMPGEPAMFDVLRNVPTAQGAM
jgi:hypothetical protein